MVGFEYYTDQYVLHISYILAAQQSPQTEEMSEFSSVVHFNPMNLQIPGV